jgi:putative glutathione S-transferase
MIAVTTTLHHGAFVRSTSTFRDWVTADGSSSFPAEAGRYHLYVSLACPWAHRTIIVRHLKRLEGVISLSVVAPVPGGGLHGHRPRLPGPRHRAGAVG